FGGIEPEIGCGRAHETASLCAKPRLGKPRLPTGVQASGDPQRSGHRPRVGEGARGQPTRLRTEGGSTGSASPSNVARCMRLATHLVCFASLFTSAFVAASVQAQDAPSDTAAASETAVASDAATWGALVLSFGGDATEDMN